MHPCDLDHTIAVSRFGKQHLVRERASTNGERDTDEHQCSGIKLRVIEIGRQRAGSR